MKRKILVSFLLVLILSSSALAVPVELKLTSYSPATLPAISVLVQREMEFSGCKISYTFPLSVPVLQRKGRSACACRAPLRSLGLLAVPVNWKLP